MTEIQGEDIRSLIDTLYGCFNGPPGLKRNWDLVYTLFIKGAHIMRTDVPEGGCTELVQMGVDEFIDSVEGFLDKKGFYGKEVHRRIEANGSLAKVLSDYEGRFDPDDPEPFRRGTNVISLYHDGFRWWIINMLLKQYRNVDPLLGNYREVDTDRYGRTVATVYLDDGRELNLEIIRAGLAWHYKRYSKRQGYADAESYARAERLGLWVDENPTPPWEWRREKRRKS